MARPCKRRRVCGKPLCGFFGPEGEVQEIVTMTLDEFETIRLIDWEGMTQEQCAGQMDVARTTVQAIYGNARASLRSAWCAARDCGLRAEITGSVTAGGGAVPGPAPIIAEGKNRRKFQNEDCSYI